MIEFITDAGVSLDLSPDAEFQIDFESPIFADDRMPVAFSTQVSFPPTPRNLAVFGFLPETLNSPTNTCIKVVVHAGGIPLFSGVLIFDGFEDKMIQYSFSGTDAAETFDTQNLSSYIPTVTYSSDFLTKVFSDNHDWFKAPLIVNKEHVAAPIFDGVGSSTKGCGVEAKYANLHFQTTRFIPAVMIGKVLPLFFSRIMVDLEIDDDVASALNAVCILCQYHPEELGDLSVDAINSAPTVNLGLMSPDITVADLLSGLMKMFCLAVFRDGDRYVMRPLRKIFQSDSVVNLDHAVGNSFNVSIETGGSYRFRYADESDNSYPITQLQRDIASGDVTQVVSLKDISLTESDVYVAYYSGSTGCVYSSRRMHCTWDDADGVPVFRYLRLTDILFRPEDSATYSYHGPHDDSETDASVDFHLVRCIPEYVCDPSGGSLDGRCVVAPVMEFETVGDLRGSDVYIGSYSDRQMTDCGMVLGESGGNRTFTNSLRPRSLFVNWHDDYAGWLAKDKAAVSVSLNLSLIELASLRLYDKVYFRGRLWLIRKLSVTFSVKTDSVKTEGEFVSL